MVFEPCGSDLYGAILDIDVGRMNVRHLIGELNTNYVGFGLLSNLFLTQFY